MNKDKVELVDSFGGEAQEGRLAFCLQTRRGMVARFKVEQEGLVKK